MKFPLIADPIPALRTSCAVQLLFLWQDVVRQGHELKVLLPVCKVTSVDGWKISTEYKG